MFIVPMAMANDGGGGVGMAGGVSRRVYGGRAASASSRDVWMERLPGRQHSVQSDYEEATRLFLHRRVKDALVLIEPYLDSTSIATEWRAAVWVLYAVILDLALLGSGKATTCSASGASRLAENLPHDSLFRFDGSVYGRRPRIAIVGSSCGIWQEAARAFRDAPMDLDVFVALILLHVRRLPDPECIRHLIEERLVSPAAMDTSTQQKRLLETYLTAYLPRLGKWQDADEFLRVSNALSEEEKRVLRAKLQSLQAKQAREDEQRRAIVASTAAATAATRRRPQLSHATTLSGLYSLRNGTADGAQPAQPPKTHATQARPREAPAPSRSISRPSSLMAVKNALLRTISGSGGLVHSRMLQLLTMLAAFLLAYARRRMFRTRISQFAGTAAWAIVDTVKRATSLTSM